MSQSTQALYKQMQEELECCKKQIQEAEDRENAAESGLATTCQYFDIQSLYEQKTNLERLLSLYKATFKI